MAPCFGPLTGVTATVHPDSSHLIILFARTRRSGRRDVAVAAPMTVGDDALRRCLNRAVMGHRLVGLRGQLTLGQYCQFCEPPDLNFSSARSRAQPSRTRWDAGREASRTCIGMIDSFRWSWRGFDSTVLEP